MEVGSPGQWPSQGSSREWPDDVAWTFSCKGERFSLECASVVSDKEQNNYYDRQILPQSLYTYADQYVWQCKMLSKI